MKERGGYFGPESPPALGLNAAWRENPPILAQAAAWNQYGKSIWKEKAPPAKPEEPCFMVSREDYRLKSV